MPAPIRDEYAALPSRQVRYQRRNRAEGLCILCRVPTEHGKLHCADCIKRTKEKRAKTQRLHRAAPAMLEALKTFVHWAKPLADYAGSQWADKRGLSQDCHWLNESSKEAQAAIAAAEGEK